jgi:hypothetical protein
MSEIDIKVTVAELAAEETPADVPWGDDPNNWSEDETAERIVAHLKAIGFTEENIIGDIEASQNMGWMIAQGIFTLTENGDMLVRKVNTYEFMVLESMFRRPAAS